MKRIFAFLLLLLVPNVVLADACTDPENYTIDKRCYVTEEQKQEKPYNAVVALLDNHDRIYCTGTIVNNGDILYLYTAKHCTDVNGNNMPDSDLLISLQDGTTDFAEISKVGNYDIDADKKFSGDFAIYKLHSDSYPYVLISDKPRIGVGPLTANYDARLVGYGKLKIMSDNEIEEYKQKYIKHLQDEKGVKSEGTEAKYGFYDGGIYHSMGNPYVVNFLEDMAKNNWWYYNDIFQNYELKVSKCKYSSNGKKINCQAWGGNSGGPIFDADGKIMGIVTRSSTMVGGKHHAGAKKDLFEPNATSIPLITLF